MSYADEAAFYRGALLLGLVRGHEVIAWADEVLHADDAPPLAFADISTTPPDDLTMMRERLFRLCGDMPSDTVAVRVLGLVQRDLASGRRSFGDTMTVLKQLRAFFRLNRDLNEQVKGLGVDVAMQRDGAEQRVREWLQQYV